MRRRTLILLESYYEWQTEGKVKSPYNIHPCGGGFLTAAAVSSWCWRRRSIVHSRGPGTRVDADSAPMYPRSGCLAGGLRNRLSWGIPWFTNGCDDRVRAVQPTCSVQLPSAPMTITDGPALSGTVPEYGPISLTNSPKEKAFPVSSETVKLRNPSWVTVTLPALPE